MDWVWVWAQQWKRDYESEGSTLANQMSLSRLIGGVILAIILCFVKMITIYYPTIDDIYWRWPAFVICFALVLTDWADGQVARSDKFKGGVTDLGKKLDPLADKVLIVSVYMALAACFLLLAHPSCYSDCASRIICNVYQILCGTKEGNSNICTLERQNQNGLSISYLAMVNCSV